MSRAASWLAVALGTALLAGLVAPPLALLLELRPATVSAALAAPDSLSAIWLSLWTSLVALSVIIAGGTPLAYWLAAGGGALRRVVGATVMLPVVLPPAALGVALLKAYGRHGLFEFSGIGLPFTPAAVVMAQVAVGAPLYVLAARTAFRGVDAELLWVARTLGASPLRAFFGVALPAARGGLLAGAGLAWARAVGEFGATLLFAGSLPGRTRTLPLAIQSALEHAPALAYALSGSLVLVAFIVLLALRDTEKTP